ncbi:LacI family DNA-binding transcriptional regulator [Glaciibacter superstes]|uniref:LacI family DNA-binding transcriptional regulator n=1 Tax=Glaciibacter superstes TaxID=501023 RepID=UPI0003B7AA87|nr:LacI family DNA-binding transcriptional regulator [Glaciibacter superstes]
MSQPTNDPVPDPGSGTRRQRVKLSDVARAAGVDLSTASRLIRNQSANYRPETVERVNRVAKELGYRTNQQARALRLGRQQAIAMLVPDLDNFGFTRVLRGAQEVCEERGFTLLISEIDPSSSNQNSRLASLEGRVDGILVAYGSASDTGITGGLDQLGLPTVLVQRGAPDATASVLFDEEANAAAMVDYLVGLGHRSVAHVSGALSTDTGIRRERGFNAALIRHGLEIPADWRADGAWTIDGGRAATFAIMNSASGHPTALSVDSLVEGIGALSALRELNVAVPGEVSVIAIDEHLVAAHTSPPLTTVRLDQRALGRRAAEMLFDRLDGAAGQRVIIDSAAEIVPRESTAPPRT